MNYKEAEILLNKYKDKVLGKSIHWESGKEIDSKHPITHIIISPIPFDGKLIFDIEDGFSNKVALANLKKPIDVLDVFVISYPVWGDGNMYHLTLNKLIKDAQW